MSDPSEPSPSEPSAEPSSPSRSPASDRPAAVPEVGVIMGSRSDWETMRAASDVLADFGIVHQCRVVSAHRTPRAMVEYASEAAGRGLKVLIAGAGGAAHLPGMVAALTTLPVIGVPVQSRALSGIDSLLSIAQMPGGVPVATMAIGTAGARNAGLLAVRILAIERPDRADALARFAAEQADAVTADAEIEPSAGESDGR